MSRRLEKLIEQKAWETLTDYGYNDAHLLEQLTESVLERLHEEVEKKNLNEDQHTPPGAEPGGFWYDYGGAYYYVFFRGTPPNMVRYYYFNGRIYRGGTGPLGGSGYPGTDGRPFGLPNDIGVKQTKVRGFKPDLRTSAMKPGVSAGGMGRMGR